MVNENRLINFWMLNIAGFLPKPRIEKYPLVINFQNSKTKDKSIAYTKLAHWYREVEEFGDKNFRTVSNSIFAHYEGILNFFDNRTTNASDESFNWLSY